MKENTGYYQPGICNIGADEISKRRKEFLVSVILDLLLTGLCFYFYDSFWILVLLFVVTAYTALMYLQIINRFCVLFGWFKKYNFGKLGDGHKINDPGQIARDRKKVVIIFFKMLLISGIYWSLIFLVSGKFHF